MNSSHRRPLVLVIDDNRINLQMLELILTREGFDVAAVSDGQRALEAALANPPDLVLLDILMPGLHGLDLLRSLGQYDQTKLVPVIMVTARTRGEDVKEALEAGAFDYVKKPLDEVEVVARVRSALRYSARRSELEQLAMRDSLTGLFNHRLLVELLDRELSLAQRQGRSVSFCMVDIDRFKDVNDRWGHQVGDLVLQTVADTLVKGLRCSDPVGRYGGEEFGIVLGAGCGPDHAELLCSRLREAVEDLSVPGPEGTLKVTVSLGLAHAGGPATSSAEDLIGRADAALYRAKAEGRNRLVVAGVTGPRS